MKCFVFSIGEKTTDLCCELMREYGYEVILYQDQTSLWEKLKRFYTEALESKEAYFVRVDADIIPTKNPAGMPFMAGWVCAQGFDFYKQDLGAISIHKMSREVVKLCLDNIEGARNKNRPESHLWRIPEINGIVSINADKVWGIHGYGQRDQRERIKGIKLSRGQAYNWSLLERIDNIL